jgi:hypothetical protein
MMRTPLTISEYPKALATSLPPWLLQLLSAGAVAGCQGQQIAQREIATEVGAALDARHQRFVVSLAEVKFVKWSFLFVQAFCS